MAAVAIVVFVAYHVAWSGYAFLKHREEWAKIEQTYTKSIQEMRDEEDQALGKMRADYTRPLCQSSDKDSLSFVARKENNGK